LGIDKYDLSKTHVIDTVRLCYVVFLDNVNDCMVHAHVLDIGVVIPSVVFSFRSYRSFGV